MVKVVGLNPLFEAVKLIERWVLLDTVSVGLVVLSFFLLKLIFLASSGIINLGHYLKIYYFFIINLLGVLILSFVRRNYLLFYFFFEASLVPTFYIIIG